MIIEYPTFQNTIAKAEVGKVYIVSLPFNHSHPFLSFNTLIAHKNIEGHGKGWTVTHLSSGKQFSRGATRKAAIDSAYAVCERYDNNRLTDVFQRAQADFDRIKELTE